MDQRRGKGEGGGREIPAAIIGHGMALSGRGGVNQKADGEVGLGGSRDASGIADPEGMFQM
jgi:hypothetical protein